MSNVYKRHIQVQGIQKVPKGPRYQTDTSRSKVSKRYLKAPGGPQEAEEDPQTPGGGDQEAAGGPQEAAGDPAAGDPEAAAGGDKGTEGGLQEAAGARDRR